MQYCDCGWGSTVTGNTATVTKIAFRGLFKSRACFTLPIFLFYTDDRRIDVAYRNFKIKDRAKNMLVNRRYNTKI